MPLAAMLLGSLGAFAQSGDNESVNGDGKVDMADNAAVINIMKDAGGTATPETNLKIKLLLIGSSHGMNTIAQLPWIAYKSGFDVEVGNVYIGSLSMQTLMGKIQRNEYISFKVFKDGAWETKSRMKFHDIISYTDWNFISLQRSASDDELWLTTQEQADEIQNKFTDINYGVAGATPKYVSHTEALQTLLDSITAVATNHPEIIFNTGFADPNEWRDPNFGQTTKILHTANMMKAEFGIDYYPTATAIRNARNTYLRNLGVYQYHNLCYDSQHLDYGIGCWVASMTLLEFVLRKLGCDVETLDKYGTQEELLTYISLATPTNYTEPTDETMEVARACAKAACDMVDVISDTLANRYKWQVTYNLSNGITSSENRGYSANEAEYTTTLSGTITSVSITMGGTDITSTAYSDNIVNIGSVTGDVTITANGDEDSIGTGINTIGTSLLNDAAVYTLDGRRVAQPTKSGLYIVNGRKVIIK